MLNSFLAPARRPPNELPLRLGVDQAGGNVFHRELSANPEMLEGKKVVIWEFVERGPALGRQASTFLSRPNWIETRLNPNP